MQDRLKVMVFLFIVTKCFVLNAKTSYLSKGFEIVKDGKALQILIDENEHYTVKKAVQLFVGDVEMMTGIRPAIIYHPEDANGNLIIAGSIINSTIIRKLNDRKIIKLDELNGKWEKFERVFIENPFPKVKNALVIAGSDRRGSAYGILSVSGLIGVSPWYWWADVHPVKKDFLVIERGDYISRQPDVQFRGIFLNDEDWGLQPWAAKTFEPETGDIGPKTYAKIFELLLRLKANTIWPAMHNCTRAFYHYPGNPETADTFGIIVGSSHAEPMLRNNVDEWDKKTMGAYNYKLNRDNVYNYWDERVAQSKNYENIYTLGMRGIHDSGMEGMSSMEEKVSFLENIIIDQRQIISKHFATSEEVPQVFITYKEVLDIYDQGLGLPDDVTIVWPDDNYGYIKRLNGDKENGRKGGSGVYYHASYWGRPHDYLWLSTTHPSLIREEMMKAYQHGSQKIWVLNVGDIKPLEYNIQLFLDMAWDTTSFSGPGSELAHMNNWYQNLFGIEKGEIIFNAYKKYYNLALQRRPEFMGWSQTEPTRNVQPTGLNHFFYGDEAANRIAEYNSIMHHIRAIFTGIPENKKDAFYQLVYYPVVCAGLMNKKFIYREKAYLYAAQNRSAANDYAQMAQMAYDSILLETSYYNNVLSGGKWKGFMSMKPRNLPVFDSFIKPSWEIPDNNAWGISVEGDQIYRSGTDAYGRKQLNFNAALQNKHFIDIFLKGNQAVDWSVIASKDWINVSQLKGGLNDSFGNKETRLWISVDKEKLSGMARESGYVEIITNDKVEKIYVSVTNIEYPEKDIFVGQDGIISIHAENFNKQLTPVKSNYWKVIEGLGYSGASVQYFTDMDNTVSKKTDLEKNASLHYNFYSSRERTAKLKIHLIPVHPLNNNCKLQFGVSLGDSIVLMDYQTHGRSEEWKYNVLSNNSVVNIDLKNIKQGINTLKIYGLDPYVIIDRVTIDIDGSNNYYGSIKETKLKNN